MIALTHLALNYNLLGKHSMNPAAVDDQTLCADTISHLATVTQELGMESSMRRVHMYTGVRICNEFFLRVSTSNFILYRYAG